MSKIIVDTIESSGTTVTVNDNLDAGANAVTAGSITGLTGTSITSGTIARARLAAIGSGDLPAESIRKIHFAQCSTALTTTSTGYADIAGMTVTLTPVDADSKFFVDTFIEIQNNVGVHILGYDQIMRQIGTATASALNEAGAFTLYGVTASPYRHNNTYMHRYNDAPATTDEIIYHIEGKWGGYDTIVFSTLCYMIIWEYNGS
jgi:hypothetical protein